MYIHFSVCGVNVSCKEVKSLMGIRSIIKENKLSVIFGKKGCGKSCTLASLACKCVRLHIHVYTNVLMNIQSEYIHFIENKWMGYFCPEPHGVFLLDEVNLDWDNRDFKSFDKKVQTFLRYQRHFKCSVVLFSQTYDIDKKIRSLADVLYIAKRIGHFTRLMRVKKYLYVTKPDNSNQNSDIVEGYEQYKWFFPFVHVTIFQPLYWRYFDSYETYYLPTLDDFKNSLERKDKKILDKNVRQEFPILPVPEQNKA